MTPRRILTLGVVACIAAPALVAQDTTRVVRRRTAYDDLQMFSQVLNQIRTNHPDSLDAHDLLMAAMRAMVRAADPHSYVITSVPLSATKEAELASGKSAPVPLDFGFVDDTPVITSVTPGSAAARADILPGDQLVAIDGAPVRAQSSQELALTLSGPRNSQVTLSLVRRRSDGTRVTLQRLVKRERVGEATAVPAAFMLSAGTGYVRITTFDNDKVDADLRAALERLQSQGMERLVLDLRDNGGGLVGEASRIAGEFLPAGTIVYTSSGRKAELTDTGRVKRSFWKQEKRYPIVVMVNEGTASASELVAGALQDHDRALIYGHPSFGKSLLMRGFPLSDGSVMMLVVGTIRTPCGRAIQREYRGLSQDEYYRRASAARDTTGRPSCTTTGGRRVYGGGGVFPDVVSTMERLSPRWLESLREQGVTLTWAGGYVGSSAALGTLDDFARTLSLPADAITNYRSEAAQRKIAIPQTAEADTLLRTELIRGIAYAKWGEQGAFRVDALLDADVAATLSLFDQASKLPGVAR